MERRLFVAILLAVVTMFLYQYIVETRYPALKRKQIQNVQQIKKEIPPETITQPIATKEVSVTNQPEKLETIKTQNYEITTTNIGASIRKIRFLKKQDPATKEPTTLIDTQDDRAGLLSTRIFLDEQNKIADEAWQLKNKTGNVLTYSYPQVNNIEVTKQLTLHNTNNTIELSMIFKNTSSQTKKINYELVVGSGLDSSAEMDKRTISAQVKLAERAQTVLLKDGRFKNGPIQFQGDAKWIALKNRYYTTICKPESNINSLVYFNPVGDKHLKATLRVGPKDVPPESVAVDKYVLYVGPQDYHAVSRLNLNIEGAIGYGFLGGISSLLLALLRFFYRVVGNYGVAIILLTIVLNIVLYPLTFKSISSMKKIQQLQPQINKLKEQHKDNSQKINKETWELYRKNKVNPLGGCLPMVLQLPIFFALYKALMGYVELKNARFLWIKDLAGPDAAFRLPVGLPLVGNLVNILPIFMLVAMFFQQKISQAEGSMGQEQKVMSLVMPVMFGALFYNFPSALVLYWLVNTLIMTAIQLFVLKK